MLVPGEIPIKEPKIRVGIILPEDSQYLVEIGNVDESAYDLIIDCELYSNYAVSDIKIKANNSGILQLVIDGQNVVAEKQVELIRRNQSEKLNPQEGLKISPVVSGRDFHWKKNIDVILPGNLIIRPFKNFLILINELPIEQYLMCVATSEMGSACPPALIEAQTIAARSWMLANVEQKHRSLNMDVCNDDCCQRYQGSTFLTTQSVEGALRTYGQVLISEDQICDARYSKSCGGVMELFSTIWNGDDRSYLKAIADAESDPKEWKKPLTNNQNFIEWIESVPDTFCSSITIPEEQLKKYLGSVDEQGTYFRWQEEINEEDLVSNLSNHNGINIKLIISLIPLKRGESGRLSQLNVIYENEDGVQNTLLLPNDYQIRQSMHPKFLYSSAFVIEKKTEAGKTVYVYKGAGWGHGVGLCQIGALGMSLKNYNAEQIVQHYFPGSMLKKIY